MIIKVNLTELQLQMIFISYMNILFYLLIKSKFHDFHTLQMCHIFLCIPLFFFIKLLFFNLKSSTINNSSISWKSTLTFILTTLLLFCLYNYSKQNLGRNQYFRNVKSEWLDILKTNQFIGTTKGWSHCLLTLHQWILRCDNEEQSNKTILQSRKVCIGTKILVLFSFLYLQLANGIKGHSEGKTE